MWKAIPKPKIIHDIDLIRILTFFQLWQHLRVNILGHWSILNFMKMKAIGEYLIFLVKMKQLPIFTHQIKICSTLYLEKKTHHQTFSCF